MRGRIRTTLLGALVAAATASCGPNLQGFEAGERATVAAVEGPTRLRLDAGLIVFLAMLEAPEEPSAAARTEAGLAALTQDRPALLAYDSRRRIALRNGQEAALAHVFVQGESGAWVWVQEALVAEGLALVRPRPGEAGQGAALLALEDEARRAGLGLWSDARTLPRSVSLFTLEAAQLDDGCGRGPYRLLEGVVDHVGSGSAGMYLNFGPAGAEQEDATARIRDTDLDAWRAAGFDVPGLAGASVRLRGTAGYGGGPLLCLEHPLGLERLD